MSRANAVLWLAIVAGAGCSVETDGLAVGDAAALDARRVDVGVRDTGTEVDTGPGCKPTGCDDGNPCTDDGCGATGCVSVNNTAPCDDGVYCNGIDACADGVCTSSGDPCGPMGTRCDEALRACVQCLSRADCPAPTATDWSPCAFDRECDETGSTTMTSTDYRCEAGSCVATTMTDTGTCSRDTDGWDCARDGRSCTRDVCREGRCDHPCRSDCACTPGLCSCW